MKTHVQQWGNSLALRIPKAFALQTRVRKGTLVDLSVSKGRMILTPVTAQEPSLKKLLSKVNKKNNHTETDWGKPEGKELW